MLALHGYFDGNEVRTLVKIHARKNQKLIITILDEFIDESSLKDSKKQSARGLLSEYANPELQKEEDKSIVPAGISPTCCGNSYKQG